MTMTQVIYKEEVGNRTTHAVGGGEWSIEVYDVDGNYIREFVGSNGTRNNERPDPLHDWADEWEASLPSRKD